MKEKFILAVEFIVTALAFLPLLPCIVRSFQIASESTDALIATKWVTFGVVLIAMEVVFGWLMIAQLRKDVRELGRTK